MIVKLFFAFFILALVVNITLFVTGHSGYCAFPSKRWMC